MKKLFYLCALFLTLNCYSSVTLEKTGLYGVYVKNIPCCKSSEAVEILAEYAHKDVERVQNEIDLEIPVFYTKNYEQAEQLKSTLKEINCEVEIREMRFTFEDSQEA